MNVRSVLRACCALSVVFAACARATAPAPAPAPSMTPQPEGSTAPAAEPGPSAANPGASAPSAPPAPPAPPAPHQNASGCRSAMFDEPPGIDAGAPRTPGVQSTKQKPFPMTTELPAGRLGEPGLDRAVRGAMAAYCAEREQIFFADAAREQQTGRSTRGFYDECACEPSYVSEKLVSVACSNQESLAGAHPSWRYAGFTFSLAGGAVKEVKLHDVCAPTAQCTKRLAELLLTLPDGPTAYHEATLAKYLARPTFVLGPTAFRLLVDEDLSGYAAHGLSCDVPYGELGALSRWQPGAAAK